MFDISSSGEEGTFRSEECNSSGRFCICHVKEMCKLYKLRDGERVKSSRVGDVNVEDRAFDSVGKHVREGGG